MYIREQTYRGLGELVGPFEGTFTGTIRGDKDSAATIKIVLADRDNMVSGQITLGKGLKLDLGGFCLMEEVDLSSITISGRTSPDNPRYFQTSVKVAESPVNTPTVKSADINVTIKANLSSDGNTIAAEVTFDPLEGVISIFGVESKADLKKKGCRAKTLPVTLNKQTPTGSLKGYIYDRPLTALPFLRNEETDMLRPFQHYYYSSGRGLGAENGALHGSIGGKRPDVVSPATQSAEVVRLTEEMIKRAQRNAWTGVEETYKTLESMGDEAFDLIPKGLTTAFNIHILGAEASRIFGAMQLSQTRLLRAKRSLDTAVWRIDDPALRKTFDLKIFELLDAIENAYGAVTIAPLSAPTSKKQLAKLKDHGPELTRVKQLGQLLPPDQLRSTEVAAKAIKDTGSFTGLLPAGDYTLKLEDRSVTQPFTVLAGTEVTGKKPKNVRWGN